MICCSKLLYIPLSRDSPDDSQTGVRIRVLRPCRKTDARCRRLPAPRLARTVVEGEIWPFSLTLGTHSSRRALERMTIGRLTLALVVAAVAVLRSAAKCPGTFPVGWRPRPFGRRHSVRDSPPLRVPSKCQFMPFSRPTYQQVPVYAVQIGRRISKCQFMPFEIGRRISKCLTK